MNNPVVSAGWLNNKEAAIYAGRKSKNAWRTINRWIRKGLVPPQFVGGDHENMVKPEGIDIAMRRLREMRLKRCGIREVA